MIFLFPRWDMLIPWRVYVGVILTTSKLRKPQHTLGAYPRNPWTTRWKEFLHKLLVGGLGYVPGVCWKILRYEKSWPGMILEIMLPSTGPLRYTANPEAEDFDLQDLPRLVAGCWVVKMFLSMEKTPIISNHYVEHMESWGWKFGNWL